MSALTVLAIENESLRKLLDLEEQKRIKMAIYALSHLNRGEMYKLAQQNLSLAEMFAAQANKLTESHPMNRIHRGPIRQYYYKVNGCKEEDTKSINCICWHDEGTGPLARGDYAPKDWRLKPDTGSSS